LLTFANDRVAVWRRVQPGQSLRYQDNNMRPANANPRAAPNGRTAILGSMKTKRSLGKYETNQHGKNNYKKETRNMKAKLITMLSALTACLAIGVSSAGAQNYSLTDLGFLPNKKEDVSTAAAINGSGHVTGTSGGAAFRYTGKMEEIGQDPNGFSRGFGIDGSGQVVGDSTFDQGGSSHAALFSNGLVYDLGTQRGSGTFSRANGINGSGQVVGFSSEKFDGAEARAFIMNTSGRAARLIDLGTLGGLYAQAWGINDSGFVTGNSQTKNDSGIVTHAFLWQKGTGMLDLGTLAGDFSYGTFINANNHVVGYSTIDKENDRVHAFLHDGKEMVDLGSLGGASSLSDRSFALGVNADGQVVGYSYLPADWGVSIVPLQQVAFVYSKGLMVNLNDLIGDAAKEYRLDSATAINDKGQIVAIAFVNSAGAYHAVLLTPIGDGVSTAEVDRGGSPIAITRATYSVTFGVLTVQATYVGVPGTRQTTLSVYDSASEKPIGTLNTKNGSSYYGSFTLKGNPQKIWVADNNGRRADAEVVETK
jgi:probable HAF family extracellular repeat protein